jgi:hypothetical protein
MGGQQEDRIEMKSLGSQVEERKEAESRMSRPTSILTRDAGLDW